MCLMCDDPTADHTGYVPGGVSRRDLLTQSAAAVLGGGAAAVFAQAGVGAQAPAPPPAGAPPAGGGPQQAPPGAIALFWGGVPYNATLAAQVEAERQATSRTAGTKFKAMVRHRNTLTMETLTLKPLHPMQVAIRNQAVQNCYSGVTQLNTTQTQNNAMVTGHGGVGIIIDVGSAVQRVKVGDQVILSATPNCGVCGNCLAGRGDSCLTRLPALVSATMADNTPVFMTAAPMGPAGHSEILISDEAWVVPVFTKLPPAEVSILGCPGAVGLGMAICRYPVEPGSDVAVWGLGPMGIGVVQGARIQGAKTIIGIDPIRYRRDLALKLGATHVLDPNEYKGNDLVAKVRELTPDIAPAGRRYVGEHPAGPLYGFEATAPTNFPLAPGIEAPPQGTDVFQQLFTSVRNTGYIQMAGTVRSSAVMMVGNKVVVGGNFPGINVLRDLPRFVTLIERGQFDAKSMIGKVFKPDQIKESVEAAGNRSVITAVVDYT